MMKFDEAILKFSFICANREAKYLTNWTIVGFAGGLVPICPDLRTELKNRQIQFISLSNGGMNSSLEMASFVAFAH